MAQLYGQEWTRAALLRHVGDIGQLAGARLAELSDGPGRGVRVADVTTGGGLYFSVLIDRGLDIGAASLDGFPLAWRSSSGVTHPALFEPQGAGWLRGFGGGLLTTCGLTAAGASGEDELGAYGLHGRASALPASLTAAGGRWEGDDYVIAIEGQTRETAVFGFDLLLTRRISARLGERRLTIEDRVENMGDTPAPLMLLYHCNFGFPLVAAGSQLLMNGETPVPRDTAAVAGLAGHARFEAPVPGYAEQVFFHAPRADQGGMVTAAIVNRALDGGQGLAAYVRYRQVELPNLIEWKQMGAGTYVVGLEPANCLVMGRAAERKRGTLQMLAPGESRSFLVELGAARGREGIAVIEAMI
ncbi:MAG TPA: aldose 1-epimerase family protein [Roseiflexaceae bacterium]|nr:aldose 1-epimerase family protein [Roseiflexaceae bacterium]